MKHARQKMDGLRSTAWRDLARDGKAFVKKHPIFAVGGGAIVATLVVLGIRRGGFLSRMIRTAGWFLVRRSP